jgi:predicted lactoylglutathione lyase
LSIERRLLRHHIISTTFVRITLLSTQEKAMKFACLGYFDESRWNDMSKGDQERMMEECFAFDDALIAGGHWVGGGQALQSADVAKTLRWQSGKLVVTDGPYAETKEQLGGLGVLEARDINEAIEIIAKHPALRYGSPFELRPIDEESPCGVRQRARNNGTQIFVNLPVRDLNRSMEFFTRIGFKLNPQFSDDTAACFVVSDQIYVRLLTDAKFREGTPHNVCDARHSTEVLVCLSQPTRAAVDDLVQKAIASGATTFAEPRDYGFMYQHGFQDPDGHIWELIAMETQNAPQPDEALLTP